MNVLRLLIQQTPTPTPVPAPDWLVKLSDIFDKVYGMLGTYKSISAAITAIMANPYVFLAALGVSVLSVVGLYLFVKQKIKNWEIEQAKKTTEDHWQDQLDHRIPDNEKDNEKDNQNRNKLDDMK